MASSNPPDEGKGRYAIEVGSRRSTRIVPKEFPRTALRRRTLAVRAVRQRKPLFYFALIPECH
eukprot:7213071-Pyramimonas_sp.AAC.2